MEIEKLNYYAWARFLEKVNDDEALIREKEKLAYSVESNLMMSSYNSGLLLCGILTTTDSPDLKSYDNVKKSIEGFHRQIGKIVSGDFSSKEFESAKLGFKRQLLEAGESQTNHVLRLSEGLTSENGIEELNSIYAAIDSLTKEDLQNAAKEIFSTKPIYSVRASKATLDANKEFLSSLEG